MNIVKQADKFLSDEIKTTSSEVMTAYEQAFIGWALERGGEVDDKVVEAAANLTIEALMILKGEKKVSDEVKEKQREVRSKISRRILSDLLEDLFS